ncbi:small integral membrane protein 1 [Astyanax mexicanus]|uniref:small integral membrane protein 1 n=1 Tax=Astyanax mexicanus TaxID=7994 RepID=UPI000BBDE1A7|nr:small integral membrane protein 1 [Astyanax mexicanus]XP_007236746.2 small integral membrane protein 1 [Astyanax mexicanus]
METGEANVQYNRWNDDNINLNVEASRTSLNGMYNKLCTGQLGIAVRVAGSLAVMAAMYILGYITGYYVHKC